LHVWEQRRDSHRLQSSCRTCPLIFLQCTMLLHCQSEVVVLLVPHVWWNGDSLGAEFVTACFDAKSGVGDLTPASTSTGAWHYRRELRQEARFATCQSESQNDISRILGNYSQSKQQTTSTAHNHQSVQPRPADTVWPTQ